MKKVDLFKKAEVLDSNQLDTIIGGFSFVDDNGESSFTSDAGGSIARDNGDSIASDNGGSLAGDTSEPIQ